MRGSISRIAEYERMLVDLLLLLSDKALPVSVIREALSSQGHRPAIATIHARLAALVERGYPVKKQRRRAKIANKTGRREYVYSVEKTALEGILQGGRK